MSTYVCSISLPHKCKNKFCIRHIFLHNFFVKTVIALMDIINRNARSNACRSPHKVAVNTTQSQWKLKWIDNFSVKFIQNCFLIFKMFHAYILKG